MKRRDFFKLLSAALLTVGAVPDALAEYARVSPAALTAQPDDHIRDYLYKMRHFDTHHEGDIYLGPDHFSLLGAVRDRLRRVQRTVGYGNFYLLSFDEALDVARNYSRVGRFSRQELDFLEMIFYEDGSRYGFFGEKPLQNLTARISKRKVCKIPAAGNYIYKGVPYDIYKKLQKDVGDKIVLTSGVRSVIKQFMLFLNKAYHNRGNLSLASRSLAPPGYSYHGIGDFDVGQVGYGVANFTEQFTTTRVFQRLEALGYIDLRYQRDNLWGVRFEPWHIKVDRISRSHC